MSAHFYNPSELGKMKSIFALSLFTLLTGICLGKFVDNKHPLDAILPPGESSTLRCYSDDCDNTMQVKFYVPMINYRVSFLPGSNLTDPTLGILHMWKKCIDADEGDQILRLDITLLPDHQHTIVQCSEISYTETVTIYRQDGTEEYVTRVRDTPKMLDFSRFATIHVMDELEEHVEL